MPASLACRGRHAPSDVDGAIDATTMTSEPGSCREHLFLISAKTRRISALLLRGFLDVNVRQHSEKIAQALGRKSARRALPLSYRGRMLVALRVARVCALVHQQTDEEQR